MRTGILTFHRSRNYGAVLQAYALCSVLNDLGIETDIIDYKCDKIEENLKLWNPKENKIKAILRFAFRYRKKKVFDSFDKKFLKKSNEKNIQNISIMDVLNQYDTIVVGSDQVWCERITGNDKTYLLQDVKKKKIAYAASVGDTIDISKNTLECIDSFDYVSVREEKFGKLLRNNGIENCVCCDPTVLAGVDYFEQIVARRIYKQKYVFVFMIWNSPQLLSNAKKFAEIKGLKLISSKESFEFFLHCKPTEFLSWIKNAEYVFTNSFHGTVFSLLFHKKFISSICKASGEKNLRVQELLTFLRCTKNILSNEEVQIQQITEPDYDIVDCNMLAMRKKSIDYLKKAFDIDN